MAARSYEDIDPNVLKGLPNPGGAMELKHKAPEVTFLDLKGASEQLVAAHPSHILLCLDISAVLLVAVIWIALRRI